MTGDLIHDRFTVGLIQLGAYPDVPHPFDMSPVDWVASVIGSVALYPTEANGNTYHIINPDGSVPLVTLGEVCAVAIMLLVCI